MCRFFQSRRGHFCLIPPGKPIIRRAEHCPDSFMRLFTVFHQLLIELAKVFARTKAIVQGQSEHYCIFICNGFVRCMYFCRTHLSPFFFRSPPRNLWHASITVSPLLSDVHPSTVSIATFPLTCSAISVAILREDVEPSPPS